MFCGRGALIPSSAWTAPSIAAVARANIEHAGLNDKVSVVQGKVEELPPVTYLALELMFLSEWMG